MLEVESIEAGESNVQHYAPGSIRSFETQKFFRCTKCLNIQLNRANKTVHRLSYRGVIVDYEYNRFIFVHSYAPGDASECAIRTIVNDARTCSCIHIHTCWQDELKDGATRR